MCTAAGDQPYPRIVPDGTGGAIVTWYGTTTPEAPSWDIYAQRVERYGQLGNPEPVNAGVRDVPNDQGGRVKPSWYASYLDADPLNNIGSHWIWRSVPPIVAQAALRAGARMLAQDESMVPDHRRTFTTSIEAGQTVFREYVGNQIADQLPGYSYVTSTTSDWVRGSNPRTLFMVEARATSGSAHWASTPDSGYSVDNLPPGTPAPFTGAFAEGSATLQWRANSETDLAEYRLYRGSAAGFVLGPGNLAVAQPDTGHVDAAGAPYYYKLCAVDVHGNASAFSTLLPSGAVEVAGPTLPRAVFLAPPAPNPPRAVRFRCASACRARRASNSRSTTSRGAACVCCSAARSPRASGPSPRTDVTRAGARCPPGSTS